MSWSLSSCGLVNPHCMRRVPKLSCFSVSPLCFLHEPLHFHVGLQVGSPSPCRGPGRTSSMWASLGRAEDGVGWWQQLLQAAEHLPVQFLCNNSHWLQRGFFGVFMPCPGRILALWFGSGLALRIHLLGRAASGCFGELAPCACPQMFSHPALQLNQAWSALSAAKWDEHHTGNLPALICLLL